MKKFSRMLKIAPLMAGLLLHAYAHACVNQSPESEAEFLAKSRKLANSQVRDLRSEADEIFIGRWTGKDVVPEGEGLARTTYRFELIEAIKGAPKSRPEISFVESPTLVRIRTFCGPGLAPDSEPRLSEGDRFGIFLVYVKGAKAIRYRLLEENNVLTNAEELQVLR